LGRDGIGCHAVARRLAHDAWLVGASSPVVTISSDWVGLSNVSVGSGA
jgi:hypothetical protein